MTMAIGKDAMRELRDRAVEVDEDTIAVVVLAGNPERGLMMETATAGGYTQDEAMNLLRHAVNSEPLREVSSEIEEEPDVDHQ